MEKPLVDAAAVAGGAAAIAAVAWLEPPPAGAGAAADAGGNSARAHVALVAALAYAANPLTLLAAGRGELPANAAIAAAFAAAHAGGVATTVVLATGVAAIFPVQGACAAPPLLLLACARARSRSRSAALIDAAAAGALAAAAAAAAPAWPAPRLGLHAVDAGAAAWPPELGLSWYLLASAFLRHMPYFATLVWLHPLAYVPPALLRLRTQPAAAAVVLLALGCLFDPSDGFALARLPLCVSLALAARGVVAEMRDCTAPLGVLAVALAAAPAMKDAWLRAPYGNANLLFNLQLVFALCCGSLVAEFAAAALRGARRVRADGKARRDGLAARGAGAGAPLPVAGGAESAAGDRLLRVCDPAGSSPLGAAAALPSCS